MCLWKKEIAIGVAVAMWIEGGEVPCKREKKSKWWRHWLIAGDAFSRVVLLEELRQNEAKDFLYYVRMDKEKFNIILNFIQLYIWGGGESVTREAVFADERLIAILEYLAGKKVTET